MDGIKLEIDADSIQKQIIDGVMQSALGAQIKKACEELANQSYKFTDIMHLSVERTVRAEAEKCVAVAVKDKESVIRNFVNQKLTNEVIEKAVSNMIDALLNFKYDRY